MNFGLTVHKTILELISSVSFTTKSTNSMIICYHSVSNDGWLYSLSNENFIKQLEHFCKHKKIVALEQLLKSPEKENLLALTFDDGYADFYKVAFPLLKKKGITGTLFIMGTENINREELGNNKKLMSIEEIKEVKNAGWEIGFHSSTHSNLKELSQKELYEEIVVGKKRLENELGFKLRYFAYPMGLYNKKIIKTVASAGFSRAFTTRSGNISKASNYLIGRVCVRGDLSFDEFLALISNLGLAFNNFYEFFITLKADLVKSLVGIVMNPVKLARSSLYKTA